MAVLKTMAVRNGTFGLQTSLFVRALLVDQNRQLHPIAGGDFLLILWLSDSF